MRHGMLGKGVALLVRADSEQLAAVQIHSRGHTALIHVIHDVAVANAKKGVNDARFLSAQQGGDADGVYGSQAHLHHSWMLNDALLNDAGLLINQLAQKSVSRPCQQSAV